MRTAHRIPAALRHGALGVLPGEDRAAFEKLHRELIAEFEPNGPLENEIVARIGSLIWRMQNLETLRTARLAQGRLTNVLEEMLAAKFPGQAKIHPESGKIVQAAEDRVRDEIGDDFALVEIGEAASFNSLEYELTIQERFSSTIERSIKQLLLVRGLKSISGAPASAPARRLAEPSKAA
jgi:hypothetical protein